VTEKIFWICRISQYWCYLHLFFAPLELDFFVHQNFLQICRPACCWQRLCRFRDSCRAATYL